MKLRIAAGLLLIVAPLTSAAAMPVSTFLAKADKLQSKGPLAMFSGDLKLLQNQIKGDAAALRAERVTAQGAGKRPAYCPPGPVKLGVRDIIGAMREVPAARRATTDTRDALRAYFARRFPCPA